MAKDTIHLGASWENNAIHFVEIAADGNPGKIFQTPIVEKPQDEDALKDWEKGLAESIKKTLKENAIGATSVNLSIPSNDIIFRSFVIPWMQPHEIKNVVEFEVVKYIPFSLSDLSIAYHPVNIQLDGVKQIRIIFVAIKLDVLENYDRIMSEAGLQIHVIEPSALSLIRTLTHRALMPADETIAMIEKEEVGRIIVSDQSIPHFVREFFLANPAAEEGTSEEESLSKKLAKEARISLDYFNRQNEQLNVEKIFYLSSPDEQGMSSELEENLGIPIISVDTTSIIGQETENPIATINAYGASLTAQVSKLVSLNLSKQTADSSGGGSGLSISFKSLSKKQWIALTIIVCTPIIIGSILMPILWKQGIKKESASLTQQLGKFKGSEVSYIEKKKEVLEEKIKSLKNTRTKSNITELMLLLPSILPEETWLRSFNVEYIDDMGTKVSRRRQSMFSPTEKNDDNPTMVLTINGYAYTENKREQFRVVNEVINVLREHEQFSGYFKKIELDGTKAEALKGYDVTSFKVVCTQTNEIIRPK